jgi:lipid-binding SYLF domain-containing protein
MISRTISGLVIGVIVLVAPLGGCSTAPKAENQADFIARADSTRTWFERSVAGLNGQIADSAGYIIFPDVAQWGILIGGGTFGRGALCRPSGEQIGWAAINTGSIGLQAGVQGFRMLLVLEDESVVNRFRANQLSGSVAGVAVAGQAGASAKAPFQNGVAAYQGANQGLMAGVNIGLDIIRFEPM